jgi:hypothetical protein
MLTLDAGAIVPLDPRSQASGLIPPLGKRLDNVLRQIGRLTSTIGLVAE